MTTMKTITIIILCLCFCKLSFSQNTYVPDDNFEQALIDLGFDSGPLDDNVPTANINTEWTLSVGFKGITDLTGIEDFTELRTLYVTGNDLTTMDLSNNLQLRILSCAINNLTSLDLSANINLYNFNCNGNDLTTLDVKNSNNTSFTLFSATENPNLNCITVDDADYSEANWTNKDAQSSFSEDCNGLSVNEFDLNTSISLYPNPTKGILNVSSTTHIDSILVYNTLGELVAKTSNTKHIDLTKLHSGIYLIKLESENRVIVKKALLE